MSRKAWFYRQLLSYMPAFFIVVSLLFFVFFQLLTEQNRKEAVRANETLLLQAMRSVDASLRTMDRMLLTEMLNNADFVAFFDSGKRDDIYLNMQVVKAMKQFMLSYPLVSSMYLVRTRDHFVLSNATSADLADFPDDPFFQAYLNAQDREAGWTDLRDYTEFAFKGSQRTVTLVRKFPLAADGEGYAVINVPAESIYGIVSNMYDPSVSFVQIVDASGADLLAAHAPREGKPEVFSRYTSPYTGWVYRGGLVNGRLVSIANQLYNVWVMLGLLMSAAGIGWVVYVTRRSYKPIEQIVSRVQSFSQQKANLLKRQDEFAFIEAALDSILEQSNRYQQEHREHLPLRKAYLFQQLLEGLYPLHLEQWENQREAMQLPDLTRRQVVAIAEIDRYAQFCERYPERDQYLLKFALRSVIQEIAQKRGASVWTEWLSASRLGMLLQDEDGLDPLPRVSALLEQVRLWVEDHLKLTVTLGFGEAADVFTRIPERYGEALQALKYKMILGENRIIPYRQVAQEDKGSAFSYLHLVQSMAQSFRLLKAEWREQYTGIVRSIERELLDEDAILQLADYMIYALDREMGLMAKAFQELWHQDGLPSLQAALQSSETLKRMELALERALTDLFERMRALREARHYAATIGEVRAYMERHFADPNLSLDELSRRFAVNGKYLSKLFKEETGQKFVDYLIELRIRHGCKLLAETDRIVQAIAEEVGYTSAISFSRVFKKVVGVSPGDYRVQARSEKTASDSAG